MWFASVPTSIGTTTQIFTIFEIGLHKRVFIITLDMIKLQKYPYTINIPYRIVPQGWPPNCYFVPPPPQQKRICMKGKWLSYMPQQSLSWRIFTSLKKINHGFKTPPRAIGQGISHLAFGDINQVQAVLEFLCGNRLCQHVRCILKSMNPLEQ